MRSGSVAAVVLLALVAVAGGARDAAPPRIEVRTPEAADGEDGD